MLPEAFKVTVKTIRKRQSLHTIYVFVSQNKFNGTNPKQAPVFVLLGNPAYGRWFLDGSDSDVRLVAVIHI